MTLRTDGKRSVSESERPLRLAVFFALAAVMFVCVVFFGQQFSSTGEHTSAIENPSDAGRDAHGVASGVGEPSNPAIEPIPDFVQDTSEENPLANPAAEESAESHEDADDASQADLFITGTVLDDRGQLLEGAMVMARQAALPAHEESGPAPGGRQQTSTTDLTGSFEFRNLEQGEYELTASKGEGYVPANLRVRAGVANAELVLAGQRSVLVYGHIRDDMGHALEGVEIRALGSHSPVRSNSNGNYEILAEQVKAGTSPVLDFSLEGFAKTRKRVDTADDSGSDRVQLDVEMEPELDGPKVALSGQVRGRTGELAGRLRVRLGSFSTNEHYSTTTDEAGMFQFSEVESGEAYRLEVLPTENYAAYESEAFPVGPEDAFREIVLEDAEYSDLTATVTNLSGQPLKGFTLWVRGVGRGAQPPMSVQTDGSGRFELEQIRAGKISLESRSQPRLKATEITLEAGEHNFAEIPLDWGNSWLLGRIVNTQGQPVSGARVDVKWKEQYWHVTSESRREVTSDLQGFFAVSNLGARDYTLSVRASGYQPRQIQYRLNQDDQELQVQLSQAGATGQFQNGGG